MNGNRKKHKGYIEGLWENAWTRQDALCLSGLANPPPNAYFFGMPAGRPTLYSDELTTLICEKMAEGMSLKSICSGDDMPTLSTIFLWLGKYPAFSDKYEKAYQARADAMFEEMFDIADDGTNDYVDKERPDGSSYTAFDAEHVQRSRLRIDTRKWALARMSPRKYGDKIVQEHTGPDGSALGITVQFVDKKP